MAKLESIIHRLSFSSTWKLALGSLILLYLLSAFRSYWRLRHIPGPWLGAVSELWYTKAATSGEVHLKLAEACSKYGETVRIGPNTVVTCNENFIRKSNSARGTYRRGFWYSAFKFDADYENSFSERDEEKHTAMRAKLASGYSGRDNPDLEPSIDRTVEALIHLIERKYLNEGRVDFARLVQYFALDTITSLTLSQPFGWLEKDEDVYQYIETLEASFPMMNFMSAVPALNWLMRRQWVQRLAFPRPEDKTGMGRVKGVARDLISRRFGPEKEYRQDMMQSLIQHGCTLQQVADESLLAILAGSDTTGTAIRMTFLHLMTNPHAYHKLYHECTSTDIPLDTIIAQSRTLSLPYLQAVVREGLRIYPSAVGLSPKIAPPGGDTLEDGTYIPAGTQVGIASWSIYHNKSVYGPDADIFRPERWIESSEVQVAEMKRSLELLFGYGRFKCLGQNVAMMELPKVIFELVRRFEWSLEDPLRPLGRNRCYGLFLQRGMWVNVGLCPPRGRHPEIADKVAVSKRA